MTLPFRIHFLAKLPPHTVANVHQVTLVFCSVLNHPNKYRERHDILRYRWNVRHKPHHKTSLPRTSCMFLEQLFAEVTSRLRWRSHCRQRSMTISRWRTPYLCYRWTSNLWKLNPVPIFPMSCMCLSGWCHFSGSGFMADMFRSLPNCGTDSSIKAYCVTLF